jgi:hypothetical protein
MSALVEVATRLHLVYFVLGLAPLGTDRVLAGVLGGASPSNRVEHRFRRGILRHDVAVPLTAK